MGSLAKWPSGKQSSSCFAKKTVQTRVMSHLRDEIKPTGIPWQLAAISYCTGVVDGATYIDFMIMTTNQTGNAILLIIGLAGGAPRTQAMNAGASFVTFLIFAFLSGRMGNSVGHRTRWWLLLNTCIQATIILFAATLLYHRVIPDGKPHETLLLILLSSAGGFQMAMVRSCDVGEIPTAVLTTPLVDLMIDRHLFARGLSGSKIKARNMRILHCACMLGGAASGAILRQSLQPDAVLLVVGVIKLWISASFWFNGKEGKGLPTQMKPKLQQPAENKQPSDMKHAGCEDREILMQVDRTFSRYYERKAANPCHRRCASTGSGEVKISVQLQDLDMLSMYITSHFGPLVTQSHLT